MLKVDLLEKKILNIETMIKMDKDEVLTIEEAAKYMKISISTIRRMARKGDIPFTRKTGGYRILKSKLIEWLID